MTADHLVDDGLENFFNGKGVFFFIELVDEPELEKEIAEFFADLMRVVVVKGLTEFMGFLEKIGFEGLYGLFLVPGAAFRTPETGDDVQKFTKFPAGFFSVAHNVSVMLKLCGCRLKIFSFSGFNQPDR